MAHSLALAAGFGGSPSPNCGIRFDSASPPTSPPAERRFLNEVELANRWGMSPKTLTRWRGLGRGPVFVKLSKKVAYPLDGEHGVLTYEQSNLYSSTSERVPV